ncbi:hypothetical protein HY498_02925 [Candidatus Woesearchaeota archaeon]|nr:hypothetical protein [Candidatus Woesearchaeota archaeon]
MVGNLPIKKFRAGNIEVAIWSNKKNVNGAEVEFKTVSLGRSYKKKDEDIWRNEVINLRKGDLQKVLLVVQKASEELFLGGHDEGGEEE